MNIADNACIGCVWCAEFEVSWHDSFIICTHKKDCNNGSLYCTSEELRRENREKHREDSGS